MRRIAKLTAAVLMAACLCACAQSSAHDRAEEIQKRFAEAQGYLLEVRVDLLQEETLHYALKIEKQGEELTAVVTEPEMLAGITAQIESDLLRLSYDGLVLEVPNEENTIGGMNCAPIVMAAVADGYLVHAENTELDGEQTLCAYFESERGAETLGCRVWFSADGLPLCGEIEKNEQIVAYMGFTKVEIHDTIASA